MSIAVKAVAIIAAASGIGKTTLMEGVINFLKTEGYRVGAVKHTSHEATVDRKGTDSWRFFEAGADVTILAAPHQVAVIRKQDKPAIGMILLEASRDTDVVLVEGFKDLALPKIEVYREGQVEGLYSRGEDRYDHNLIAVATDADIILDVPVLDLNDPEDVGKFIVGNIIEVSQFDVMI